MTGNKDDAAFEELVRTRLNFSSCMITEIKILCVYVLYIDTGLHTAGDQLAHVLECTNTSFFVLSFTKTNDIVGSFLGR